MSLKGTFDGWHGDEYECTGNCGICEKCESAKSRRDDDAIDAYLDNDQ
jgi:hypothetical protein